ncbi:MAG: DUF5011 domain-containing protein [Lachnospiraceae bacterium]|nr:DUF5011 domain-containing protein [Lachnospiraceae bacterium]
MKRIRVLSVLVFLFSLALFGFFRIKHSRIDDSIAPRISMESETIEISVEDGDEAILSGVTASDSNDGDVSDTLIVESMGQFLSPGRRNVTVAAFDSASNVAKETRQVIYTDYTSPVFSLSEPLRFPVNTSSILDYVTVTDVLDGDLTNQIKVSQSSYVDTSVADDYETVLTVTNSAGDTVKLPCTVTIYDTAVTSGAPVIELSEYLIYVSPGTKINAWDYITSVSIRGTQYTKAEDGNLYSPDMSQSLTKSDFSIKGDVDTDTEGTYEYTYKITDSMSRTGSVRLIVAVR